MQNGTKFIQKLTSGFKNHMRNLNNFRKAVESLKSWNLMGFCPKNTFLQLKHYIQRIYLTFSCTFLAETLYAVDKSSTSKCKFWDLPMLALKFTKFLMSFLEPRVSFSTNFASLFSVMRHTSSVLFHLNLFILWTKRSNESANFQSFDCLHKN